MSENALVIRQTLTPETWKMIADIAPTMAQSRLFGVTSPEQAASIMLKGFELGLSLTASFEFIHIIDGKPGLSPRGALALIQQSENFGGLEVKDISDTDGKPYACRVKMTRKNGFSYTIEFTMDDAKRAGVVKGGGGWDKYPANMLRWRAIGYCADVVFPDVIGGMKRVDELGAPVTQNGDFEPLQSPVSDFVIENGVDIIDTPKIPAYGFTMARLMEVASNDDIMAANNGAFPVTPEQINVTVHTLVQAGKIEVENG